MILEYLQLIGACCFGILIGWYIYYINRHRGDDAQMSDLVTLVGAIGGATILTLFPAGTDLFGAYGVGLAIGFFGYFAMLLLFVKRTDKFDTDYFLDGRRKDGDGNWMVPPLSGQDYQGAMEAKKEFNPK